jgi:hypothetical protein
VESGFWPFIPDNDDLAAAKQGRARLREHDRFGRATSDLDERLRKSEQKKQLLQRRIKGLLDEG